MAHQLIVNESYIEELKKYLSDAKSDKSLFEAIVNAPFYDRGKTTILGLGFISFVLVNKKTRTIDRVSISHTDFAQGAIAVTVKPFKDLIIPIDYKGNIVAEAIRTGQYRQTSDWDYLLKPVLKPEEARLNQAGAGIATSFVYPLIKARDGGAIIFQFYVPPEQIGSEHREFMFRYTKLVSKFLSPKN